jgi:CBS domain-containing protein
MSGQGSRRNSRRRRERQGAQRWRQNGQRQRHGLDLTVYLDDLAELRVEARDNLPSAGERALKVLDRFLANLGNALGMNNERASMGDSMGYLRGLSGVPRDIAIQAERYRDTRNALAHNPDIMLRPEAANRIIDGIEEIVRTAAEEARDLSRSHVVTALDTEPLADARDRLLEHRYDQLVVVDGQGGVVDLLTDRDIVVIESQADIDAEDESLTVADALRERGHSAVAILPQSRSAAEAIDALRDERVAAVVITERGEAGEPPLGIVTRKDVLRAV